MQQSDIKTLLHLKEHFINQSNNKCFFMGVNEELYSSLPTEFNMSLYETLTLWLFRNKYYTRYGLDIHYFYSTKDIVTLCNRSRYSDSIVIKDIRILIYDNLLKKYNSSHSVATIHSLAEIESGKLTVNEYIHKLNHFIRGTVVYNYNGFNTPINSRRQREAVKCAIKSIDHVITDATWQWKP